MACKDPAAFRSSIAKCNFNKYGGVTMCPAYTAATKANGAKCLALSIFDNGPPFGDFACKGATGEMATMCKAAGFPVTGAGAGAGTDASSGSGEKKGTMAKVGGAIASVPGSIADGYSGMSTAGQVGVPIGLTALVGAGVAEGTYRMKRRQVGVVDTAPANPGDSVEAVAPAEAAEQRFETRREVLARVAKRNPTVAEGEEFAGAV